MARGSAEAPALSSFDGLPLQEIGGWTEEKYELVEYYADLFTKAMRRKWQSLVYLDLFAGAGRARVEGTHREISTTPMRVLELGVPFDRYIFCDLDNTRLRTLEARVAESNPRACASFACGDANRIFSEVLGLPPGPGARNGTLTFCLLDPFRVADLKFDTVRAVARHRVDFLVLIPTHMDVNRNEVAYSSAENRTLDEFLGTDAWRGAWAESDRAITFGKFIAAYYAKQMGGLGYRQGGLGDSVLVRMWPRKVPLYRLVFFSRSPVGERLWGQATKYSSRQRRLFD